MQSKPRNCIPCQIGVTSQVGTICYGKSFVLPKTFAPSCLDSMLYGEPLRTNLFSRVLWFGWIQDWNVGLVKLGRHFFHFLYWIVLGKCRKKMAEQIHQSHCLTYFSLEYKPNLLSQWGLSRVSATGLTGGESPPEEKIPPPCRLKKWNSPPPMWTNYSPPSILLSHPWIPKIFAHYVYKLLFNIKLEGNKFYDTLVCYALISINHFVKFC